MKLNSLPRFSTIFIALVLFLAACSGSDEPETSAPPAAEAPAQNFEPSAPTDGRVRPTPRDDLSDERPLTPEEVVASEDFNAILIRFEGGAASPWLSTTSTRSR